MNNTERMYWKNIAFNPPLYVILSAAFSLRRRLWFVHYSICICNNCEAGDDGCDGQKHGDATQHNKTGITHVGKEEELWGRFESLFVWLKVCKMTMKCLSLSRYVPSYMHALFELEVRR